MKYTATSVAGVWLMEMERHEDERGWFSRTWCSDELRANGLEPDLRQCSASFNRYRGTLRGMHYQTAPHEETKIVRCTRGKAYDVALDLRRESSTYLHWTAFELSGENGLALYIPKGCAHGFQTLEDNTEILYSISNSYHPSHGCGVRWNDPTFQVSWPLSEVAFLSTRDANYPDFVP